MFIVLLLDLDLQYCLRVCALMNLKSKNFRLFNQADYMDSIVSARDGSGKLCTEGGNKMIDIGLLEIKWESTLVIYNPRHFFNPPEKSYIIELTENPLSDDTGIYNIYKYCSVSEMAGGIDNYARNHPLLVSPSLSESLICILGTACPQLRRDETDKIKQEKLAKGLKVVQIDLCPPYFIDPVSGPSTGYTLSDAFLRLMADDLSFDDFGVFLVPMPDGILQFRPIERADDLLECKPAHLRQFVELIRKWIARTDNQYFVAIQCYAIPFSFIYAIAVLCDRLILLNQDDSSSMTVSYNRELGHLLSNLPNSCKVEEILIPCPHSGKGSGKPSERAV